MTPKKENLQVDRALARGLVRLLSQADGSLPEGRLLAACGGGAPRKELRRELTELVDRGLILRQVRGRGARLTVAEASFSELLGVIRSKLSPRARLSGADLLGLLTRSLDGPAKSRGEAPVYPPPSREDQLYATITRLAKEAGSGGMVRLWDVARALGESQLAALSKSLDKLERARAILLEPLSDPRVVPVSERTLGIDHPVRGLLYFVSLPKCPEGRT